MEQEEINDALAGEVGNPIVKAILATIEIQMDYHLESCSDESLGMHETKWQLGGYNALSEFKNNLLDQVKSKKIN